jgi:hypothetical protein
MLSKVKHIALLALVFSVTAAQAATISNLTLGKYSLVSGDKNLCDEFEVIQKDITDKKVKLGAKEFFALQDETSKEASDLDANCEFKQTSTRKDSGAETVLSRTNEELCKGKLQSKSVATATIKAKEIKIVFLDNGKPLGTCHYKSK